MKTRLASIAGLLAASLCVTAYSQTYQHFPGTVVDQRTRQTEENVEDLYTAGHFRRALLIYEKDLAPLGDKYAQYMVGYMHLQGEGTTKDPVEALAWYRLAAERGEPILVEVRDELLSQLSLVQMRESDGRFLNLWKLMSDRKILLALIEDDLDTLQSKTGTRISRSTVDRPSIIVGANGQSLGPSFYADTRKRLAARIEYLDARVEIIDDILVGEIEKTRAREAEFKAALAALENR